MSASKATSWAFRTLETERLRLRSFEKTDVQAIQEIFSDEETLRYWAGKPIDGPEQAQALLRRELELSERDDVLTWAIALPSDNRLLGKFTLFNYSEQNRRAEVGYLLDRRHWGKGYMSEVMACLVDYAFNRIRLHRLEADTDPLNEASLALLAKFGFEREGLFRDRWLMSDGWADSVMLGLINQQH